MSNYLAVDAASRHLTVLAVKGDKVVLRYIEDCSMRHSELIMGEIEMALDKSGLLPAECDFFAAVTGPGSFTGIRIGISTVKGLALGAGKKLVGVTAFDLVSYNVNSKNYCIVIDAAHNHFYARGYGENKFPPAYLSAEEVRALNCPLFGYEKLDLPDYTQVDVKNCLYNAVEALKDNLSDDISALYVRKSQAEEGRK